MTRKELGVLRHIEAQTWFESRHMWGMDACRALIEHATNQFVILWNIP